VAIYLFNLCFETFNKETEFEEVHQLYIIPRGLVKCYMISKGKKLCCAYLGLLIFLSKHGTTENTRKAVKILNMCMDSYVVQGRQDCRNDPI
jgi:hypothetical protein